MMRYQKIVAVLMTFLVLLNVSACARSIQDDLQSSSEEAHEEQSEVKEAKSVLPNSWKMEQFVIAGFDKDGPGDFGRDRKSTRQNSSHSRRSRMPSSA